MPAKIIAFFAAAAALLGLRPKKPRTNVEDLIVNSFNKSHSSWVSQGWVEPEKQPNRKA